MTPAQRAIAVVNILKHTKGPFAGQPFNLRPWQRRFLQKLFTVRKDGLRQYRTCLLMLPRKNGKSEIAAALAVYFLIFDREMGGEVYSAAADRDQAGLVFNVAAAMIRAEPELLAECEIIESQKRIVHRPSGSIYRAISAEAYSKHGFNASVVIYDELHAAPNRELYDVLATSTAARAQPLLLVISTAGYDRHSILWELYEHAKKVAATPDLDPTFLPCIYEAPEGADWTSEKTWRIANPALGDFRSLEEMRTACARAQQIPAQENPFKRLYLNLWTEQAERWMPLAHWQACQQIIDWTAYHRRPCCVGMDLASTQDITALVAVFPGDDGSLSVLPKCFIPADTIREKAIRDRRPLELWRDQGYLVATPGNVVDYEAVRATLHDWASAYDVRAIAYDPWNATDLTNRLQEQDGFKCTPIRQGFASLSAPTKELEKVILSRKLRHDGHPVLADHIANAAVEHDAGGNIKLSKKASTERIDAAAALVCAMDAVARMATAPPPTYDVIVLGR